MQYSPYLRLNRGHLRVPEEIKSRNTMSDFRSEVEILPFHACAMKNTQYNPYLCRNRRKLRVLKEIGAEEHDDDVRS